jgi:hypothetical protein
MNPGIDKIVFKSTGSGKHPYFDVSSEHRALANNNFNLSIPELTEEEIKIIENA